MHRRPNEAFHEDRVKGVVQEKSGPLMFWGCFTESELGLLVAVNKTLNEHDYFRILDEEILPFSYLLCENSLLDKPFFQDDNCCMFRAIIVADWFDENHSKELFHIPWPAKSFKFGSN